MDSVIVGDSCKGKTAPPAAHSDLRRKWWEKGPEQALQLVVSSSVLLKNTGLVLKQAIDQAYRISRAQWV